MDEEVAVLDADHDLTVSYFVVLLPIPTIEMELKFKRHFCILFLLQYCASDR